MWRSSNILGSHSRVMKGKTLQRKLLRKAKLSVFKSTFVPILIFGHESLVITKTVLLQMQASEIRFLRKIKGVTMFDKHRNTEIRKSLDIESLLLRIESSQLRWFGHVSRMPDERLHKQTLYAKVSGKRPVGRPRTRWLDYSENLGWNRLKLYPSKMQSVLVDREVWRLNLELPQHSSKNGKKKKNKTNVYYF